jgi:hypothetical protein
MLNERERLACAVRVRNDLFRLGAGRESLDVADDLIDELRPQADDPNAIVGWVAAGAFVALLGLLLLFASGCTQQQGQDAKTALQAVDGHVQAACTGLAKQLALQAGSADADKIVATTCAVEGFARTFREMLLSQQIEAARAAGVFVPSVNSGAFEDAGATQAAE